MNRRFVLGLILAILVCCLTGCFEKNNVKPQQPQNQTSVVEGNKVPEAKLLPDDAELVETEDTREFEGDGIKYIIRYVYNLTCELTKGTISTIRIGTAHQIDFGEDTTKDVIALSTEQGDLYLLDLAKSDLKSAISIIDMDEADESRELVVNCMNSEGQDVEYKFKVEDGHLTYIPDDVPEDIEE